MILSDGDIIERVESGDIVINPFNEDNVEPASVDLRLGNKFKRVEKERFDSVVDTRFDDEGLVYVEERDRITIKPGDFVLATTEEHIELPDDLAANVEGRSSFGRLGPSVHQTAGFGDPGYSGQVTLELSNQGPAPVKVSSGQRICQIVFKELSSPADKPYGHERSQYQGQTGPTESGMDFS